MAVSGLCLDDLPVNGMTAVGAGFISINAHFIADAQLDDPFFLKLFRPSRLHASIHTLIVFNSTAGPARRCALRATHSLWCEQSFDLTRKGRKVKTRLLCLAGLMLATMASQQVHAAFVRTGTGSGGTDANAAFALWQTDVNGVFVQDSFDGLSGSPLTTTQGNSFTPFNGGSLSANSSGLTGGVIDGTYLRLDNGSGAGGFTWSLATPSYAFGMFGYDNDGGTLSISFVDGTTQNYTAPTGPGSGDSTFWGISGLTSAIASVSLTTTDPPGISRWDNFVYGGAAPVPEPASLAMWSLVGGIGFMVRRQRKKTIAI
ncbi:MAG: PEP-CTERM sorting domain-containing protein [Fuerstiella sp.]